MSTSSSTYPLPKVASNSPLFEWRLNSVTLCNKQNIAKVTMGGRDQKCPPSFPPVS